MSQAPSGNGGNGRDAGGRFLVGNPGGPGNPYARRVAELRAAVLEALTPEDLAAVVGAMVTAAKGGDVAAARLLLAYAIGTPPERLTVAAEVGPAPILTLEDLVRRAAEEKAERERRLPAEDLAETVGTLVECGALKLTCPDCGRVAVEGADKLLTDGDQAGA